MIPEKDVDDRRDGSHPPEWRAETLARPQIPTWEEFEGFEYLLGMQPDEWVMPIEPGTYVNIVKGPRGLKWKRQRDVPKRAREALLHKHRDGSYSHLVRIEAGVEFRERATRPFHEEAYYISGEMLNTRTRRKITGGTYVYHKPGEEHRPFRCLKTCLILEFRYYR